MSMTLEEARSPRCRLLEVISGSRAYGLAGPDSDTDIKGVFVQPFASFCGLEREAQLNNASNDIVFYELGRFAELLGKSNPNLLEALYTPPDCVLFRHPLLDAITPQMVLSRRCFDSFARYALTQIQKARGLNKKIVNPMNGPRKGVLDFCHVIEGQGSVPLPRWLDKRGLSQRALGLSAVPHVREIYGVYLDDFGQAGYRGVVADEDATEVRVSSVPKEAAPVAWMGFNKDGFKKYCREWAEYQQWLAERNEARYRQTETHGQGYDAKNLMHTFRLLDLARQIAEHGSLTVRVADPGFLLGIKSGAHSYEWLLAEAQRRLAELEALYAASSLPPEPDCPAIEAAVIIIRKHFWAQGGQGKV